HIGLDRIIENVIERLGKVEQVYLAGKFARGLDSQIIDLIFIGDIDKEFLIKLIDKAEQVINRKIRYLIYQDEEFKKIEWIKGDPEPVLLWSRD
ncbi:MAG: ArsR family transcriptional regulator, partial [Bacteroidota bacterium]